MEDVRWLKYWKKGLSDSLKADIEIEKLEHFEIENFEMQTRSISELDKVNLLIDFEEARLNKKRGISDRDSENWVRLNKIQIVISPIKIKATTDNLVMLKDKKPKFPFWFFAILDREGRLGIPEETFPIFQRKYLEPLADERTEFIFGSVERIDKVSALGKEKYEDYPEYINYLKTVFKTGIGQEIENYTTPAYETIHNGIILLPDEDINAAAGIIHLYEKILHEKNLPELLKSFINLKNEKQNLPITVSNLMEPNALHLGQMGFGFPLSISQRKSLYTYLNGNDRVFAVNGPPGTGKTTLLQSIVASKFVESAINGDKAPIILACSTNNQAVTNIIDSFSKTDTRPGNLEGRWLPDVEGYATYLPSNGKTDLELEGINFKKINGDGLFHTIENVNFLERAKDFFIEKCETYFGTKTLSIRESVMKLQKEIIHIQSLLKDAALRWSDYLKKEEIFLADYLSKNLKREIYYKKSCLNEQVFKDDIKSLNNTEEKIIQYFNNEPFFRKLFCLFGFKTDLKSRASEVNIILRDSLIEVSDEFVFAKSNILEITNSKIQIAKSIIEAIEKWRDWKTENEIGANPPRTEEEYWGFELLKIKDSLRPNCFYDELDVSFRHKAFQLALHFWEGEYLIKLEEDLADRSFAGKGLESVQNRWERQAMLTPCFVSTFFMAPKFFSWFKFLKKGEDGKNLFDNPPLFDFIDLLIVDEAGQVSPEVGVATFALAKQAVIVGDVKQIEPVWNITHKIDVGNLKKCGLIENYEDPIYEREFDPKGFLCSTGSIMKMAQNACNVKESGFDEKGVVLVEHRRCYDEIINYCNVLAYNGQLVALKGKAKDVLFPPMYCIHVEGNSTVLNASRHNQAEVMAIVNWLTQNRRIIEEKYGKLESNVGIITPFTGQKNNLSHSLKKAGFDVNMLKLGTVHALQGAERPIVLFSMVYGKGDSGTMFFDRNNKPNMLNVAVSRARDNFIVFADTKILNKKAKSPSGILAKHLTYDTESS